MNRQLPILLILVFTQVAGCTATPGVTDQQTADRPTNLELQVEQFQQAKDLYLQQQYQQAAALFLALAQQGHLDSQYVTGYMYHYGYGLPRNEREALHWISIAAARGHARAQQALQMLEGEP